MPETASEATAIVLTRSAQFSLSSSCISRPRQSKAEANAKAMLSSKGGLAQLVERLLCKQNVNGSNPLTSTIFQDPSRACGVTPEGKRTLEKQPGL